MEMIVQALRLQYEAEIAKAKANIQVYIENPAGIGEHPDIVDECEKLVEAIASAEGKIQTLTELLPKTVEDKK
mgnify:CR=1 FL=1